MAAVPLAAPLELLPLPIKYLQLLLVPMVVRLARLQVEEAALVLLAQTMFLLPGQHQRAVVVAVVAVRMGVQPGQTVLQRTVVPEAIIVSVPAVVPLPLLLLLPTMPLLAVLAAAVAHRVL